MFRLGPDLTASCRAVIPSSLWGTLPILSVVPVVGPTLQNFRETGRYSLKVRPTTVITSRWTRRPAIGWVVLALSLGMTRAEAQQSPSLPRVLFHEPDGSGSAPPESTGEAAPFGLPQPVDGDRGPLRVPDVGTTRVQAGFPRDLVLPPPTAEAIRRAKRFVEAEIDPEIPLSLVINRPKILRLAETPQRVFVPDEQVIQTEVLDQERGRELAITGVRAGTTTLTLWFEDDNDPSGQSVVSYLVRVFDDPILARPLESLEAEINEKFPNSFVDLDEVAGRLIVSGQAHDVLEMSQILQVLAGARGVRAGVTRPGVPLATPLTVGNAFNFSEQVDPLEAEEEAAARRRVIDPLALAQAGIINRLEIPGEQQVMLKVTVAEVNRSAARSVGMNFDLSDSDGLSVFQQLTGDLISDAGTTSSANILTALDHGQFRWAIEALRNLNLSRTLAEPNLIALNGESADFQAGGRFPVPVLSAGGAGAGQNLQGVSFIPFGVQLRFTPIIRDRDAIRLRIDAEVSTRDESLGTTLGGAGGGTSVSGLNSRNFSTTVQLRSGQTIAVAGLLQTNYGASTDRIPLWGDLPLLGLTGGANRNSSGEQELVILVTPELIAPLDACSAPSLPGSDIHEPSDIEFYLSNRLESRRSRDHRASVRTDFHRQYRAEHCCPELHMVGDVGPTDRCSPRPAAVPHRSVPRITTPTRSGTNRLSDQTAFHEMVRGAADE